MKSPNLTKTSRQAGLTLIEALVAITVLTIGVLGPLTIAARGIGDGLFARNQLAANYLAQEAIEMVVNKRYYLAHQANTLPLPDGETIFSTDTDIANCVAYSSTSPDHYCSVDPEAGTDEAGMIKPNCSKEATGPCQLLFDAGAGGSYHYRSGVLEGANPIGPTFTRLVRMEYPNNDDKTQLKVTVKMQWFNKDVPQEFTLIEHLFNKG